MRDEDRALLRMLAGIGVRPDWLTPEAENEARARLTASGLVSGGGLTSEGKLVAVGLRS